jgi:hypothetical protein
VVLLTAAIIVPSGDQRSDSDGSPKANGVFG